MHWLVVVMAIWVTVVALLLLAFSKLFRVVDDGHDAFVEICSECGRAFQYFGNVDPDMFRAQLVKFLVTYHLELDEIVYSTRGLIVFVVDAPCNCNDHGIIGKIEYLCNDALAEHTGVVPK